MCGRITCKTSGEDFQREFKLAFVESLTPRYNIAPTQPVPAALNTPGPRMLEHLRWGLIPQWAKDPKLGVKMINARAETLAEKPAYRFALERRRCVVFADGFYEWKKDGKGRQPFHIQRRGGRPFAMAGLWDEWVSPAGELIRSCTVVTTAPNALMAQVHDRMPLILLPEEVDRWLTPGALPVDVARQLLTPTRVTDLELFPVVSKVNSVTTEGPELLERVTLQPPADLFAGSGLPGVAPRS